MGKQEILETADDIVYDFIGDENPETRTVLDLILDATHL